MKKYTKPDFIGVGMRKCGTSWLFDQLRQHPEFDLSCIKEFRFFFEGVYIPKHGIRSLIFSNAQHYKALRRTFRKRFSARKFIRKRHNFRDYFKYYFFRHTFEWYANFFKSGLLSGEFTPGTWDVPEWKVKEIHAHFPHTKIIFVLRDPVSRLWSNYKMNHKQQRLDEDLSSISIDNPRVKRLTDQTGSYVKAIEKWQKYFPEVGVFYFDKLKSDPQGFLKDVYTFLGCRDVNFENRNSTRKKNEGLSEKIPAELEANLIHFYMKHVEELIEYDPSPSPKEWRKEYKERLAELTNN